MKLNLDRTDLNILKTLQESGKISNVELSKRIGLSPAPTLERVKKLEASGVIKSYHALVDADKLGLGFQALVNVSLSRQMDNVIATFVKKVEAIPEIVEVFQITGSFDYQLRVHLKDIPAFEKLIAEKLSKIDEIGQMQTMVILNHVKRSVVVPIDYANE